MSPAGIRRTAGAGLRRLAPAVLAGVVLSLVLALPASAHAVLVHSSPADGARVDREPAAVSLTFDEAVQPIPASEQVISTSGSRVDTGRVRQSVDGATLTLPLRPGLPKGSYTAVWRVVSADTHIVSGSITFGIGVDPAETAARPADRTGPLDVAADIAQALLYAGLVLLLGLPAAAALWWGRVLGTRRVRVLLRCGWLGTLVGTAGALLSQGPRAVDSGWTGVWRLDDLGQTVHSAFGAELIARLVLLGLVLPLTSARRLRGLRRPAWASLGVLAASAVLVTVALTGHESVGPDVPLAMLSAMLHLVAVVLWLGGLTALAVVVLPAARRAGGPEIAAPAALRSWSATAYGCVACLVVTGEYQASRQLAPVQSLWSTRYGVVLLIKLGLVALIVAAAAVAQRRVHRGITGHDTGLLAVLRRSVRIELALAAAVLAVTAVLVSEPPGNTTYGPPADLTAPLGPDTVRVHVDSTLHGRQILEFEVVDAEGRPAPVQSLTATLTSPEVASLAVKLTPDPADRVGNRWSRWRGAPVVVPDPGVWTVDLDVAIDNTDAYASTTRYQVW